MALQRRFTEKEREELLMEAKNVILNYKDDLITIKSTEIEKDGIEIIKK